MVERIISFWGADEKRVLGVLVIVFVMGNYFFLESAGDFVDDFYLVVIDFYSLLVYWFDFDLVVECFFAW